MTDISMTSEHGETSGSENTINRRDLLMAGAGSAVAVAGGPLLASAVAAAAEPEDVVSAIYGPSVNGTLKEIVDSDTLVVEAYNLSPDWAAERMPRQDGSDVRIGVSPDATLYRDGPSPIADFEAGEKIVVFVRPDGSDLIASAVEPQYVLIEARVSSRSGDQLQTSEGTVVVHKFTKLRQDPEDLSPAASLAQIDRASKITATCRLDLKSGNFVAANISAT